MLAKKTLPESAPQARQQIESVRLTESKELRAIAASHFRMLSGFTSVLLGSDTYFREIDAQVDRALARQHGAR
jgi:hypothetical protein